MFKHLSAALLLTAFWWLSGAGFTHAAVIQLPQTGQTVCYDTNGAVISCLGTGQDGDIQAGVAWPNPRYTDNSDGSVTDNLTGLIWSKNANLIMDVAPFDDSDGFPNGMITWQHALDFVKKINAMNYLGKNDWRLPNLNELLSLVPDKNVFINVPTQTPFYYWSSTSYSYGAAHQKAFAVPTPMTQMVGDKSALDIVYVWPVRGGESGAVILPATGQTNCYDASGAAISCAGTGQDGELQKVAAWPNPRFTDNGDQSITDNLTGLIWPKDADSPGPTVAVCGQPGNSDWQHGGLDYVKCLNLNSFMGKTDWRLPNINELRSMCNVGQTDNAAWLSSFGFTNVKSEPYWSSTSLGSSALQSYLDDCATAVNQKNLTKNAGGQSFRVFPVRGKPGPASADPFAPVITSFTTPDTTVSLTVPITTFSATDNTGVTGYYLTETAATPDANTPGWSSAPPTTYVFSASGSKILYAWAKDASGNVSVSKSSSILVKTTKTIIASESFDGSTTPNGWTIVTSSGQGWGFTPRNGSDNKTGGSGGFAVASGYSVPVTDTELQTPTYNLSTYNNVTLRFKSVEFLETTSGKVSVDISADGGSTWNNDIWSDTGQRAIGGYLVNHTNESIDITSLIAGKSSVKIRFHFNLYFPGSWAYQWQVDDFELTGYSEAGDLPTPLKGDVNADGMIDIFDALLTLQYGLNLIPHDATSDANYLAHADVAPLDSALKPKGDSKIDIMDALVILQRSVNLLSW